MEATPSGENTFLEPLEQASLKLLNDYLTGKSSPVVNPPPDILKVKIAQELNEGKVIEGKRTYIADYPSDSERVRYLEGADGNAIIYIPEHHAVIAELDDKTALVTDKLLTCRGYGMKMEDIQNDNSVFSLVHFSERDGLGRLQEFLDSRAKSLIPKQIAYSLARDIASYETQLTRQLLSSRIPPVEEVVQADAHSYMRMTGMIITKKGGVFLVDRRIGNSLTPQYAPKLRWNWNR